MHFQLYKEDVFAILKTYLEFEDYTIDRLKSDLNALVEWNVFGTIETKRSGT